MEIKTFTENLIISLVNDEALSKVLLKMQVIVDSLGNKALKAWLNHELNGYPSKTDVPTYRKVPCELQIDASKPMGLSIKNGRYWVTKNGHIGSVVILCRVFRLRRKW